MVLSVSDTRFCMEICEGIQKRLRIRGYFPVIRRLYGDLRGNSKAIDDS